MKREHGIIQDALLWLENLSRLSEVTDIIPGVIDVSHSSERGIVYKYETQTGCKLLLKSNGSIQEVFVVTKKPGHVQAWVEKQFPPEPLSPPSQIAAENKLPGLAKKKLPSTVSKSKREPELMASSRDRHHSKKRPHLKVQKLNLGNQAPMNVADRLDRATLQALGCLKQSLENIRIQEKKAEFKKSRRR